MAPFFVHVWNFYRRGWRPLAGWTSGLILLVNGAILPMSRLLGYQFEPLDWRALSVFVSTLLGMSALRAIEKIKDKEE